jgi:TolB protein
MVTLAASLAAAVHIHAQSTAPVVAKITKLTNIETSYPNWSPDGRQIAYQSNRTGNSEIYVMSADGTGAIQLTHDPAVDENPSFSPDGRRIAFRSYRDGNAEIYTMAVDGSDVRNLTRNAADDIHPYWTPDGKNIVFNSNRLLNAAGAPTQSVFIMRSDGSEVRRVIGDAPLIEDTYAQFSPDGSQLAFRRRLDEETPGWEQNPGNSEIFTMNADGSGVRRLTDHPGFDGWPSWSPDGRWIAFASERTKQYQIYLVHPDGTGLRQLTTAPGNFTKPIFSPDGRRMVCTRTLDGNVEIFVLDLQPG